MVFHRLRAATDAVLVAAGTARVERYRRPVTDGSLLDRRRSLGLADHPRLVVVSRSLRLPADLPLLGGDGPEPLVLHPGTADTADVPTGVELRAAGDGTVDLVHALRGLRDDGIELVLCEGGPSLLGQLHRLGALDELSCTISPLLVGGGATGLLGASAPSPRPMHLHRLLEEDGSLFTNYRAAP